jgi:NAD(P)-dependent dehydrogenase (short-subunit alcohol dehydrogenase family)
VDRLAGKVSLITGAASGLGEAIARRFADEGAAVVIADVDLVGADEVTRSIGSRAASQVLDVTDEASWLRLFSFVKERYGRLDVLVNNAGITTVGSVESLSVEQFRTMLEIDLVGVFLATTRQKPA